MEGLSKNPNLVLVDLSSNKIDDSFIDNLVSMKTIEELILTSNQITNKRAARLKDAVIRNDYPLRIYNLSDNPIEDKRLTYAFDSPSKRKSTSKLTRDKADRKKLSVEKGQ